MSPLRDAVVLMPDLVEFFNRPWVVGGLVTWIVTVLLGLSWWEKR